MLVLKGNRTVSYSNQYPLGIRYCLREQTCQVSAPQTEEDTKEATPEEEAEVTAHPDTTTALEAGSGTSQPDHNTKHLTLTTGDPRWEKDSGDTWTTMNRCLNVTLVSFSSHHHQRSWGQGQVDITTPSSASTTPSLHPKWVVRSGKFKQLFPDMTESSVVKGTRWTEMTV